MVLAYIAYGKSAYLLEARFSILSALRWLGAPELDALRLIVFTDQPAAFRGLPATLRHVQPDMLKAWSGTMGYIHRAKIIVATSLLREVAEPVLLLDTDTFFNRSPHVIASRITAGSAVLHRLEGSIYDDPEGPNVQLRTGLRRAWPNGVIRLPSGRSLSLSDRPMMWNSGVIGVHPKQVELLEDALYFCDQVYQETKVFHAEQFALGQVLSSCLHMHDASAVVEHYWDAWINPHLGESYRGRVHRFAEGFLHDLEGRPLADQLAMAQSLKLVPFGRSSLRKRITRRLRSFFNNLPKSRADESGSARPRN